MKKVYYNKIQNQSCLVHDQDIFIFQAIPDKETREGFEDVVFEVFDGNDDGVIDFAEFMARI